MSIATARIFAAMMGALASAFVSQIMALAVKAYPHAFNEEAIKAKAAVGFLMGVGWIIRMIFWNSFCPGCAVLALVAGPIIGAVALTLFHFVGEMLWATCTDLWSVGKAFFISARETYHVPNAV